MARTQIRANSQIIDQTFNYAKIEPTSLDTNFAGGVSAQHNTLPSALAVKTYVDDQMASISNGLLYKGIFDAAVPNNYTALTGASQGDFYKISVSGTIGGVIWTVGDMLIINKDCVGVPTAADVDKIDNTEDPDIIRELNTKTMVNKTMDGDLNTFSNIDLPSLKTIVGDANLYIRRDAIGAVISSTIPYADVVGLDEQIQDVIGGSLLQNAGNVLFTYDDGANSVIASVSASAVPTINKYVNETLTDSGDRTIYTCSQVPVLVISITVDGLEQEEGYDYTINWATKTVTFSSANNPTDRVRIKYFRG